jgi:NAD(P)-dependent dehydrogenase (short-subunit alcohol dehydrogenase family)
MIDQFNNKIVVVTGAGGEIGQAAVKGFLDGGASVVAADRDAEALSDMAASLASVRENVITVPTDVTKADQVQNCVKVAMDTFGRVDAYINNAGVEGLVSPIEDYPEEAFDEVIAVNVRGVFLGMKYAVPALRRSGGGSIVNLASVAGLSGGSGTPAYNASKHAVIGLTRSGAVQLGPENIRVNAVCPSPMMGRMMSSLEAGLNPEDPEAIHESIVSRIPMQRYAEADDVANLILHLTSDQARFLNGGIYTVDGGMTAGL